MHLRNEPFTFNLAGCASYLDHGVHPAHLGSECGPNDTEEILTAVLEKGEKCPRSAPPTSMQSTFLGPAHSFSFHRHQKA